MHKFKGNTNTDKKKKKNEFTQIKGVDREKSAVFKELTQNFRTYELRGQAKKKKKVLTESKTNQYLTLSYIKLSPKSVTSPLNKDIDLRG